MDYYLLANLIFAFSSSICKKIKISRTKRVEWIVTHLVSSGTHKWRRWVIFFLYPHYHRTTTNQRHNKISHFFELKTKWERASERTNHANFVVVVWLWLDSYFIIDWNYLFIWNRYWSCFQVHWKITNESNFCGWGKFCWHVFLLGNCLYYLCGKKVRIILKSCRAIGIFCSSFCITAIGYWLWVKEEKLL